MVGNVVDDLVVRPTAGGDARLSFRVCNSERYLDRQSQEWRDGKQLFINVVCWRDQAENVAASIRKGDPVVVVGKLSSHQFVRNEENRISFEIAAQSVGPDLSRGTARFERRAKNPGSSMAADEFGMPVNDDLSYITEEDAASENQPEFARVG